MGTFKAEMRKNTVIQIVAGVALWFMLNAAKKKPVVTAGDVEPVGPDYVSQYFTDKEYFGSNVIPVDYYKNWLFIARDLDKIRKAWDAPILIKKGFSIADPKFAACRAVEIYPQNNDHQRLNKVVEIIWPELSLAKFEYRENKNIYLEF